MFKTWHGEHTKNHQPNRSELTLFSSCSSADKQRKKVVFFGIKSFVRRVPLTVERPAPSREDSFSFYFSLFYQKSVSANSMRSLTILVSRKDENLKFEKCFYSSETESEEKCE